MKREKYNHIHRMFREYDYTYIIIIVIFAIIKHQKTSSKQNKFSQVQRLVQSYYCMLVFYSVHIWALNWRRRRKINIFYRIVS